MSAPSPYLLLPSVSIFPGSVAVDDWPLCKVGEFLVSQKIGSIENASPPVSRSWFGAGFGGVG